MIYACTAIFYGIRIPVIHHMMNAEAPSSKRATIVSLSNFATQMGVAIFMPFIGYLTDLYTINTAYLISGIMILVAPVLYLFLKEKK